MKTTILTLGIIATLISCSTPEEQENTCKCDFVVTDSITKKTRIIPNIPNNCKGTNSYVKLLPNEYLSSLINCE